MNQNSIFQILLEVNSVKLYDPQQATNTCPLGLSFRFPGLVDLEIREGEFCGHTAAGGNEVRMTKGLSCLFMVDPANVFQTVRQFYADVGVYRYVTGGPEVRLVAQTRIEFNRTFTELIEMPDQPDRTRELNRVRCTGRGGGLNRQKKNKNYRTNAFGDLCRRFTCTRWTGRIRWAR